MSFLFVIWYLKDLEELEREKKNLQREYENKIRQLHKDIEQEQETSAKAATEMENLRQFYQDEMQKIKSSETKVVQFDGFFIHPLNTRLKIGFWNGINCTRDTEEVSEI